MTCPICAHENPQDALFCSNCGSGLEETCAHCGALLPAGARFCPTCGQPVAEASGRSEERKLVTVLFADVTGSTGLGERFDPEDLAQVMTSYFKAMRGEVEAEGGTVEKFIGDAVMAVFGVPTAHEDDPARALNAALRMMARLDEVNKDLTNRQGVSLDMRIGVNTGEVLANTEPRPGEPMVTGDTVNVAARLQTSTQPGQILVGERTARAVRQFNLEELGELELRGKEVPVRAFRLIGRSEGALDRGIPGLVAPMVGRDSELALLRSIYQRTVSERRPNLVTLYGVAGVGKSRLSREFLEWVLTSEPSPLVVRGRCLPYGDGIAYWPLAEIVKEVAGIRDSDTASEALGRLGQLGSRIFTPELTTNPDATVAALGHTMGVVDPAHSFKDLDPREVRALTNAAWRALFTALSGSRPLVAVVEDIHWADPALLDVLEELTERVSGPVLIVCPSRPELTDRRPGWGGGRRNHSSIFLDPLTDEESNRLVDALLSIAEFPASVRQNMMEKAEGNPFFLEEIIRHLIDQGHLIREGSSWQSRHGVAVVEIPDTVQAVLAARIDLLEPLDKRVLQRAAVVGRVFWTGPVSGLLEREAGDLRPILDDLEGRELIQSRLGSAFEGEQEYIFKHVLTREVAYESLPRRERGPAHAMIAGWIEETPRGQGAELVELLSYHWGEAYRGAEENPGSTSHDRERLRLKAYEATLAASDASRGRAVVGKAATLAEAALSLAEGHIERARALTAQGMAALYEYAGDIAWFSLKEAVDLLVEHAPSDRRLIARTSARAVETPSRWSGSMKTQVSRGEVERYIDLGMSFLDPADESEEMVRLLLARSLGLFSRVEEGDPEPAEIDEARGQAARAVAIAKAIGRVDLQSAALDALGSVETSIGDYRASTLVEEQRLMLLEQMANPWEVGDALAMGAWNRSYIGQYRRARDLAIRGVEQAGHDAPGVALHNLAWASYADFWLGEWDLIVDERSAQVRRMLGERLADPPYFTGPHFGVEAFIHTARRDGEMKSSLDLLDRMVNQSEAMAGPQGGRMWRTWEAWIRVMEGDVVEGLRRLDLLSSQRLVKPIVEVAGASARIDAREFSDAERFMAEARSYADGNGIEALHPHLDRLSAALALDLGDTARAIDQLLNARSGFSVLGVPWEVARTDLWLAEGFIVSRDVASAVKALDAALPVLEELGSLIEIERARELLTRI